jgi:serine/threonine protein kinase
VDHRSDQWALACMVWHMLSGRPPFTGGPVNQLLDRVVRDEPPSLLAAVPGLPPDLERVLLRGLAKRQSQRFPTVTAFLRAFESVTATSLPP